MAELGKNCKNLKISWQKSKSIVSVVVDVPDH